MNDKSILERLEKDLDKVLDVPRPPTKGFWIADSQGRIVPANSKNPELDYIADMQTAPKGPRNIAIVCAASVMFDALKAVRSDPARKHLSSHTRELIDEALTAAE